jgi:hypothetical protein
MKKKEGRSFAADNDLFLLGAGERGRERGTLNDKTTFTHT